MLVVPLAAGLPCGARAEVVPENSLRGPWPLRSNSSGKSVYEARCARPPRRSAPQHQQGARPDAAPALFRPAGGMPRLWPCLAISGASWKHLLPANTIPTRHTDGVPPHPATWPATSGATRA